MSDSLPTPPAGLPPTVASYRPSVRSQIQAAVAVTAMCLGLVVAKGAWPPPLGVVVFFLAGLGFFCLTIARRQVWAGPGWLASRGLLRTRYVRTDALVSARDIRSGIDRLILLRDAEGREVGLMAAEVREFPRVLAQVQQDVGVSRQAGMALPAPTAQLLGLKR